VESLVRLLEDGASIAQQDPNGYQALHHASASGSSAALFVLLNMGANVNAITTSNRTSLFLAADGGHVAVVKRLLGGGADPNIKDVLGKTPMDAAKRLKQHAVMAVLRAAGTDAGLSRLIADMKRTEDIEALLESAKCGDRTRLRAMLSEGASVQICDQHGDTVLHAAAGANQGDVLLELVLEHGADVDTFNAHCNTPLHLAVRKGHLDATRRLLAVGANSSLKNGDGVTAIELAQTWKHTDVEQLLSSASEERVLEVLKCEVLPGYEAANSLVSGGRASGSGQSSSH